MGISKYIIAAVLACYALGSLQAANEASQHQKKHYIDENDLQVSDKDIVLRTPSGPVKLKILRSDKYGPYVFESDAFSVVEKWRTPRRLRKHHVCYCLKCNPPRRFESRIDLMRHMQIGDHD